MRTLKQFRSALLVVGAFAALFLLPGCPQPTKPCPHPNPLVTFDALNSDGFSVTPDTIAQATSVVLEVTGSSGAPKTTFTGQPGVAILIDLDTSYHRPLRLKFAYKTASNETVSEDELRIDDTQSHGVTIPDMDVIVGISSFQNCPGSTTPVTVNTNNGVSTFSWNIGDAFEVHLLHNGTDYKFRVHPVPGAGDNAGIVTIYERPSQACLSDITTEPVSTKEMAITTISNNCTVRAWNDGSTRTVTIKHPSADNISVSK